MSDNERDSGTLIGKSSIVVGKLSGAHLESVDLLRALAIILVFLFHSQEVLLEHYLLRPSTVSFFGVQGEPHWSQVLLNLSPTTFGWSGVELFLLISGFLIHYNTVLKAGVGGWKQFYSKRFWRIHPPYLLALVVFGMMRGPFTTWDWTLHALQLHNLTNATYYSVNSSFWSLALEVQLYLIYPLLLWLRARAGMARTVGLIAALSLSVIVVQHTLGPFGVSFRLSLPRLWVVWALGAWIAERYASGKPLFRGHAWWIAILVLTFPFVCFSMLRDLVLRYQIMLMHAVLLEWVLVRWRSGIPWGEGALGSMVRRSLVAIGVSSYSLYLYHQPFLPILFERLPFGDHWSSDLLRVMVSFLVLAVFSYGMYKWVEQPSIRVGQSLRKRSGVVR
jgi:peptidoglycan/LPS O-acetylase OafA/YrhL